MIGAREARVPGPMANQAAGWRPKVERAQP